MKTTRGHDSFNIVYGIPCASLSSSAIALPFGTNRSGITPVGDR
jgi:hypothetical protein